MFAGYFQGRHAQKIVPSSKNAVLFARNCSDHNKQDIALSGESTSVSLPISGISTRNFPERQKYSSFACNVSGDQKVRPPGTRNRSALGFMGWVSNIVPSAEPKFDSIRHELKVYVSEQHAPG